MPVATRVLRTVAVFHPEVPTAELHQAKHSRYTERYKRQREMVDRSFHGNYTLERQALQDRIIDTLVPRWMEEGGRVRNPWLLFSAGAMGAGKTRTLHWMAQNGWFPLSRFVFLDHDAVKYMLPEMWYYQLQNPDEAGSMTQQEAGYIVEIAQRRCVDLGLNCLVDGSLKNHNWYKTYLDEVRDACAAHKFGIIHVKAEAEFVKQRAKERALVTGRHIPTDVLEAALRDVPNSVRTLTPHVDLLVEIDNSGQLPPRLDAIVYPEDSRLPLAGVEVQSPSWETLREIFSPVQLQGVFGFGVSKYAAMA
eukprot:TRINITY_DN1471_c2_g1_i2.p1 TRINITY_DN1471_c2_g1~~TRINITY_DN1471_c2_g1_i2.p1  ORF type:complete len:307 (+),score=94.74 TRINITY_DN1471_c2_g1_i2:1405-2325(+)